MINSKFFAFLFVFLCLVTNSIAQDSSGGDMQVHIDLLNPSSEINNGVAKVNVKGGQEPYQYKWSNVNTPLEASESLGLIEGMTHTVIITDANGQSVTKSFTIPAESITEVFNSAVQPAVDVLGAVLFWDAFATLGLYDPVVYSSEQKIPLPASETSSEETYHVKEWLVADGTQVKKGEAIAVLESDNQVEFSVYATANGTLNHITEEGVKISRIPESGSFESPLLAKIELETTQPLLYPNGDIKTNTIPFIVIWLILGSIFFTLRLKFVNIRGFRHSIQLARGKYDDPDAPGTITHFQAMATAVSATVGLGNIAGVAVAISLGGAFMAIIDGAFSAEALKGGFIGVLIIGLQRAAFSSEAGVGSAAIAHSASKTNHPIADGFTSLVEPFIDTMLICTMTALVLIFSGMHLAGGGLGGVELTADAFGSVVSWFPSVLAIAVFLFAFSTMVSWSYYGMRSWTYLFGRSKKLELVYKVLYLVFVVLGASVSLGAVLSFADMMILAMSFPNIIGLYILAPEISADMKVYWQKLKDGKLYINPKFLKTEK